MPSSRQLPYNDAMRCIKLFDSLDKFALVKFNIDCDESDGIDYQLRSSVRQLWQKDRKFITEFLAAHKELPPEDVSCVRTWRKNVNGEFVLLKYYREYAIFYSLKAKNYYAVKALTQDFKVVFPERAPLILETTLYTYNDHIIWDGIASVTNLKFGKNMTRSFAEEADEARENGILVMQL